MSLKYEPSWHQAQRADALEGCGTGVSERQRIACQLHVVHPKFQTLKTQPSTLKTEN